MSSKPLYSEEEIAEAKRYFAMRESEQEEYLAHYGVGHLDGGHSGRYPFGSGDDPYQRNAAFLKSVKEMKEAKMSEPDIAKALGFKTTTELRSMHSMAANYNKLKEIDAIKKLRDKGLGYSEIGRELGINESTVRSRLNERVSIRAQRLDNVKDILRDRLDKGQMIDVGTGTEYQLNVARSTLDHALVQLKDEGYNVHEIKVAQAGNAGKYTTLRVIAPQDMTDLREVSKNRDKIKPVYDRSVDIEDGQFYVTDKMKFPAALDSKRVLIRYATDKSPDGSTGDDKDGTIELRRGVEDISLGDAMYSQVRINVDNKHYLKGMALYRDDIPEGYDVVFNTNKAVGTPPEKVFKPLKRDEKTGEIDPNNPFGASIMKGGQREYDDPVTGEKKLSVINKVNDEGEWGKWSKTLPSQMLSKQPVALIKQQLKKAYDEKHAEFEEIMSLTNPTVKQKLLQDFGDECDGAATDLKAAALPRQAAHVLIPIPSLKDNEIYAPNYQDGETVVLIRFPHAGRFEIPELIVNNKNKEAMACMKNAPDAVGVNKHVADRLSGADFDGDTALVIPNNDHKIKTSAPLPGLVGFDPKKLYKLPDDAPQMKSSTKQMEMGKVSNLITDMTLRGATPEHLERAVKHSMVVIDAEKHHLDWKQSEIDNNIAELKQLYQGGAKKGASTIISRASSEARVALRKSDGLIYDIDPATGKKIYQDETDPRKLYYADAKGKQHERQSKISKMEYEFEKGNDAFALSSGFPQETEYAKYANSIKLLGNQARKNSLGLKQQYDPSAAKIYAEEVRSLDAKLNAAKSNAPYERQAQLAAGAMAKIKIQNSSKELTGAEKRRIEGQCLSAARANVGAGKQHITISDREWEAIQAGAISQHKLKDIMANTKAEHLKALAMPRQNIVMTDSKVALAKAMAAAGRSTSQIAERLGVSTSTISNALKGGN